MSIWSGNKGSVSHFWGMSWKRMKRSREHVTCNIFKYFGKNNSGQQVLQVESSMMGNFILRFWFEFVYVLAGVSSGSRQEQNSRTPCLILFLLRLGPMQIIVSTPAVFSVGCVSVSNYSPRESLSGWFSSSCPFNLPSSGAVSVFLKEWKPPSCERVYGDISYRICHQCCRSATF